jgi:hypothetical protein
MSGIHGQAQDPAAAAVVGAHHDADHLARRPGHAPRLRQALRLGHEEQLGVAGELRLELGARDDLAAGDRPHPGHGVVVGPVELPDMDHVGQPKRGVRD